MGLICQNCGHSESADEQTVDRWGWGPPCSRCREEHLQTVERYEREHGNIPTNNPSAERTKMP